MMNIRIKKRKVISWILFIFLCAQVVLAAIFLDIESTKYFSGIYLIIGIILISFRCSFTLYKRVWVFSLLIVTHVAALLVNIFFSTNSVVNILTLIISYLALYYLVSAGCKYLGADEFENLVFKYLQYNLLISLIVSPLLTFLKWPSAPAYFPWQALFSDQRFLLLTGNGVGHSNAMWLMAFSGVNIIRNIFTQNKPRGNFVMILILFFLTWTLIATKSRIALVFILIFFLGWAGYSKLLSMRLYALIPIIGILFFYLTILNPLYLSTMENTVNVIQEIFPSIRIRSSNTTLSSAYSGRNTLNIAFISSITAHPWFGVGNSAPILFYGITQDGYIAYDENKIGGSESMLRMLVKYGLFYYSVLFLFILTPLIRAFNGYYRDNIFVVSVCSIILISGINGTIFENLYTISSVFTIFILVYLVMPKYVTR